MLTAIIISETAPLSTFDATPELFDRYNKALARVKNPLKAIDEHTVPNARFVGGTEEERRALELYMISLTRQYHPEAAQSELLEAIEEGRPAILFPSLEKGCQFWGRVNGNAKGSGGKCWAIIEKAVLAHMQTLNEFAELQFTVTAKTIKQALK